MSSNTTSANKTPMLSHVCFVLASFSAVLGISLGLYMGINEDHSLTPVHAHVNLVGWVSLFLFGIYYRLHPHVVGRLAKLQVTLVVVGLVFGFATLSMMLTSGEKILLPLVITGSMMIFAGFILFCFLVCREAFRDQVKMRDLPTYQQ